MRLKPMGKGGAKTDGKEMGLKLKGNRLVNREVGLMGRKVQSEYVTAIVMGLIIEQWM